MQGEPADAHDTTSGRGRPVTTDRTNSAESRSAAPTSPERSGPPTPAISVEGLSVHLGGELILDDVSLRVPRGDFLGIIGPNGAGKSVLLRAILGQTPISQGRVLVFGRAISQARGRITYVPQFAGFDRSFPIRVSDVVLMGRLHRRGVLRRWTREDREVAYNALARVDLAHLGARQTAHLSGGELQRVLIARALAVGAEILLLDEPSASLDARVAGRLYALLSELATTHTLVLVSHDVGVMSRHVRTLLCLNRRVLHHGPPELSAEVLRETYGHSVDAISHAHDHAAAAGHPSRRPQSGIEDLR